MCIYENFLDTLLAKNCTNVPISFTCLSAIRLSPYVTTPELLNGFSYKLISNGFTKICKHIPIFTEVKQFTSGSICIHACNLSIILQILIKAKGVSNKSYRVR